MKRIRNLGFTLIELLVVFSIIGILSTISLAAFANYGRDQRLNTAASDLISTLQQAKSRTQSQVKPSSCVASDILHGYEVQICGLTGSSCLSENTYGLYVKCGTKTILVNNSVKSLPSGVLFANVGEGTTSTAFLFQILTGGVSGNGTIRLTGENDRQKTITVSNNGNISIE